MCIANSDCASANCASLICSALGCQTCWKVQYSNANAGNTLWSYQVLNIVSIGTTSVPLSQLKIRYWFDADSHMPTGVTCDSAQGAVGGCTNVTMTFVAVTPARTKATYYLEIGFAANAPTLAAGSQTQGIQTGFHYETTSWPTVTRTNDYSFDATKTTLTDWSNVTLYNNGNKVWGNEPP
jgi:cellulose 1,4-beta-cellobiosidase